MGEEVGRSGPTVIETGGGGGNGRLLFTSTLSLLRTEEKETRSGEIVTESRKIEFLWDSLGWSGRWWTRRRICRGPSSRLQLSINQKWSSSSGQVVSQTVREATRRRRLKILLKYEHESLSCVVFVRGQRSGRFIQG